MRIARRRSPDRERGRVWSTEAAHTRERCVRETAARTPRKTRNEKSMGKYPLVCRNEKGDTRGGSGRFRKGCPSRGHLHYEISRLVILDQENFTIVFVHPNVGQIDLWSLVRREQDVFVRGVLFVFLFCNDTATTEM